MLDGEDVLPILTGKRPRARANFVLADRIRQHGLARRRCVAGALKYLTDGEIRLLFDLETDPGEKPMTLRARTQRYSTKLKQPDG